MKKHVTSKDIAKYCGVSQATVSYVINNNAEAKISEETRKKVLAAVKEMNYFPNLSARSMRKNNCTSIGIICARDYSRQAFLDALLGIYEYLDKLQYTITIFNEDDDEVPNYVRSYFSNLVDGLIYISNNDHKSFTRPAAEHNIPYVVICMDGVFSQRSPMPCGFDDALTDCASFCLKNRLKRIRYFSVENDGRFVNHKYPAFHEAMLRLSPQCEAEHGFDIKHIVCHVKERRFEHMAPFLEDYMVHNTFDIAISQNYDIGLILQKEILKKGFAIPQPVKNIFLNYVNFYDMTYPSITGISIPYTQMGRYAAKLVMAIAAGEEKDFSYENFKCQLVHRQSTELLK